MTDVETIKDIVEQYNSAPAETLEQHIMDIRIAKSEAEWWACKEIENLRDALAAEKVLTSACERVNRRNDELLEEVGRLREALKPFAVPEYTITRWYGTDEEPIVDDATRVFSSLITVGDLRNARKEMGETE